MKGYRAIVSVLALLVLAGLSCEFLDTIQQDPSLVQNPDLSAEQREATQAASPTAPATMRPYQRKAKCPSVKMTGSMLIVIMGFQPRLR